MPVGRSPIIPDVAADRDQMTPKAAAEFSYRLTGRGWSEGSLRLNGHHVRLTASYLSDALGDLVAGLVLLAEGESPVTVSWEEEPGEYRFVFTRADEDVRVEVLSFNDIYPGPKPESQGTILLDTTSPLSDVLSAFAKGTRAVLDENGLAGYRDAWVEHDFPLADLEALERTISS